MLCAIVKEDIVENVIVINEEQIPEIEAALGCELVDARPYGLTAGDLRTPAGWTRNAGGEQMILPLLEQESYDSYTIAATHAAELEEQMPLVEQAAAEGAAAEAMAILTGEVEV